MAELHWFPFFAKDWLSSPARMAMTPAQRGAYIDLLAFAWGNGDSEPHLDPNPAILAGLSGLGKQWTKLSPLVLAQFEERDGLLYNAKLSRVWHDQQGKHDRAVINGRKGGRPRKATGKPKETSAFVQPKQSESESERLLVAPTEPTSKSPPLALGVGTPRPAELPVDRDVRNAGWQSVKDTLRAIPHLRAKPA
jgi:hypothetical protein